jgi:hypothetical protein
MCPTDAQYKEHYGSIYLIVEESYPPLPKADTSFHKKTAKLYTFGCFLLLIIHILDWFADQRLVK